ALAVDAGARGCRLTSVWAVPDGGAWLSHLPGAPAFVNAEFGALFPGDIPAGELLLISCEAPGGVTLSESSVFQGGALEVRVAGARSGSATFLGRAFVLTVEGGDLVGYVAAGTGAPIGAAPLVVTLTDAQGVQRQTTRAVSVRPTQWTVDYIVIPPPPPPDPDAPPPPPDEQPRLDAIYAGAPTPRLWQAGWAPPLGGALAVSGYFGGQRSFNGGPVQGHHGGTDFAVNAGVPILATNAGTVVMSELTKNRGSLVVIDHGSGVYSSYGHMSSIAVPLGARVAKGDVIGYVGSTGLSTGPHLHWELAVGGVLVDGLRWLDGSQGF
ncbi:MAG: M23 family metallopeptidase, partial [Dehalococcoidia bacterium]